MTFDASAMSKPPLPGGVDYGYFTWSNKEGAAQYGPQTPFTATDCDNDGLGLNQMLSDMAAENVCTAYLYLIGGNAVVNPSGTASFGTSGIQLQPGFPYQLYGWNSGINSPYQIRAGANLATYNAGGAADLLGIATSTTGSLYGMRLVNLSLNANSIAIRHVMNLSNPVSGGDDVSLLLISHCDFYGTGCTSDVVNLDYHEGFLMNDRCEIRNPPTGYGLHAFASGGGFTFSQLQWVNSSGGVMTLGAQTVLLEDCIIPQLGIVFGDTAGYTDQSVCETPILSLVNCFVNQASGNLIVNNEGSTSSASPRPLIVSIKNGAYRLDNGTTAYYLVAANGGTGGPVILTIQDVAFYSTVATGHLMEANAGAIIDRGGVLYGENMAQPLADSIYPVFTAGATIFEYCAPTGYGLFTSSGGATAQMYGCSTAGSAGAGTPAASFVPRVTGRIYILFVGKGLNSGGGTKEWKVQPVYNTSASTQGGASAGTAVGSAATGTAKESFVAGGLVTGLTVGTTYYVDAQVSAPLSGDGELTDVSIFVWECLQ